MWRPASCGASRRGRHIYLVPHVLLLAAMLVTQPAAAAGSPAAPSPRTARRGLRQQQGVTDGTTAAPDAGPAGIPPQILDPYGAALTSLLQPRPTHVTAAAASAVSLLTAVYRLTAVIDDELTQQMGAAADAGTISNANEAVGSLTSTTDWEAALLLRLPPVSTAGGVAVQTHVAVTALRVTAPAILLPASVPCHGASLDDLRSRLTVAAQRLAAAANDTSSSAIQASASVTCEGAPRPPEPPGAQAPPPPDEPAYDAASVGDPIHADCTAAHRRQRRRGSRLLLQQAVSGTGAGSPGASAVPASSATASDCATALGSSISQVGTAGLLPGQSLLRVSVRLDVTAPSAVPAQANSGSHGGGSGGALDAVSGLAAVKEVAAALAAWRTSAASNVTRNAISSSSAVSSASGASSSEVLAALEGLCIPSAMHLTVLAEALVAYEVPLSVAGRTAYLQTCSWAASWGPSRGIAPGDNSSSSSGGTPFLMSRAIAASAITASSPQQAAPLPRPPVALAASQGMAPTAVVACEVSDVALPVAPQADGDNSSGSSRLTLLQPPAALLNSSSPAAILYARWEESVPESVLLPSGIVSHSNSSSSNTSTSVNVAPRSMALAERYVGAVEARVGALRVDVPAVLLPEQLPCSAAELQQLRTLLAAAAQRLMLSAAGVAPSAAQSPGAIVTDSSGVNVTCVTAPDPPSPPAAPPAAPPVAVGSDAIPANLHVRRRLQQGITTSNTRVGQGSSRQLLQQDTAGTISSSSSAGCVKPAAITPELLPPGQSLLLVSLRLLPDLGAAAAAAGAARSGSAAGEEALEAVSGVAAAGAVAEALQAWRNTTAAANGSPGASSTAAAAALAAAGLCLPLAEQLAVIVEAQVTYRVPLAAAGRDAYYQACNASARAEAAAAANAAAAAAAPAAAGATAAVAGGTGSGGSANRPSPGPSLPAGSLGGMAASGGSILDSVANSTSTASQAGAVSSTMSGDSMDTAVSSPEAAAAASALAATDTALGMAGVSLCRVLDVWPDVTGLPIDPGSIWAPFDTDKPLTAAPTSDGSAAPAESDDSTVATQLSSPGVIIAFAFAAIILVLAVVVVTLHAIRRKRRARRTAVYLTDEEKAAAAAAASAASALQRALSRRGWRHGKKKLPGGGKAAAAAPGLPALQEDWQAEEEWDEQFRQRQQEIINSLYGAAAAAGIIKVPSRSAAAAAVSATVTAVPMLGGATGEAKGLGTSEIEPAFDDPSPRRTSGAGTQHSLSSNGMAGGGSDHGRGNNAAAAAADGDSTMPASTPEAHVPAPYGPGADKFAAVLATPVASDAGASRRLTDSGGASASGTTVLTASAPQVLRMPAVRPPSLRRQAPPPSPAATNFRVTSAFTPAASARPVFAADATALGGGPATAASPARTASDAWRSASGEVALPVPPRPSMSGAALIATAAGSSSGGSSSSDAGSAAPSTAACASRPSTADSAEEEPGGPGTRGPSAAGTHVKHQQHQQHQQLLLQPQQPQQQRLVPRLSSRLLTTRQSWTAESLATGAAAATAASPAALRSSTGTLAPQQPPAAAHSPPPPERLFYTYIGGRAKLTDLGSNTCDSPAAAAAAAASSPFGGDSGLGGRKSTGLRRSMSTAVTSSLMASASHALQQSSSGRAQDGAPEQRMRRSDSGPGGGGGLLESLVATAGRRLGGLARSRSARLRQPKEYLSSVMELGSGVTGLTIPVPEEDSDAAGSDIEHGALPTMVAPHATADGSGELVGPQQLQAPAAPQPCAGVGPGAGTMLRGVASPFGKAAAGKGFDRAGGGLGIARGGPAAMLSPARATSAAPELLN